MAPRRVRGGTRPTIHEDQASREGSPAVQSGTPVRTPAGRAPLGELSHAVNTPQPEGNIILEVDLSKPAKKSGVAYAHEAQVGILVPFGAPNKENVPEVVEDRCSTTASPAVDAACRSLRKSPGKASSQRPLLDSPRTPASRAATTARKLLASAATEQESNRTRHKGAAEQLNDDTGSPASKAPLVMLADNERLEDSVAALDAFEDVIAEIGAALPAAVLTPKEKLFCEGAIHTQMAPRTPQSPATPSHDPGTSAAAIRPTTTSDHSAARSRSTLKRKSDALKPAGQSSKSPKQTPQANTRFATHQPNGRRSTFGPRSTQRPASLRKAPFVPERSSKPATTSTFALPGEAVAAKLKARREEREKRASLTATAQAEKHTTAKRHSAAFRPAAAATVRGTTTSTTPGLRARGSVAARAATLQSTTKTKAKPVAPAVQPPLGSVRTHNRPPVVVASRKTITATAPAAAKAGKRTSSASTTATQVNGSTRAAHKSPVTVMRPPRSLAGIFTPPTSSEDSASFPARTTTRPRAPLSRPAPGGPTIRPAAAATGPGTKSSPNKAVTIGTAAAAQVERKAREEAARKARKDAAERGRLASREWAERQRQRRAEVQAQMKKGPLVSVGEVE